VAALKFLRGNLDLAWIPVWASFVQLVSIFIFLGVAVAVLFAYLDGGNFWSDNPSVSLFLGVCWGVLFLFVMTVVGVFSSAVLLAGCMKRLRGEVGTKREAWKLVWERKSPLLVWALMLTSFGLIVHALERSHRIIAMIVEFFLNGSFSLAAYFGLPVLLFKGEGPLQSLKTGIALFGQGWLRAFSVGVFLLIPFFVVMVMIYLFVAVLGHSFYWPLIIFVIALIVVLSSITMTLDAVVRGALYIGLFEKSALQGFDADLIEQAIVQRKSKLQKLVF
jgi:hypothetical protein